MQDGKLTEAQSFSLRLETAIAQSGEKKADIAKDVGVHPVSLSRYLKGRVPEHHTVYDLADRLRVSRSWLLDGIGPMSAAGAALREMSLGREPADNFKVRVMMELVMAAGQKGKSFNIDEVLAYGELKCLRKEIEHALDDAVVDASEARRKKVEILLREYLKVCSELSTATATYLREEIKGEHRKE